MQTEFETDLVNVFFHLFAALPAPPVSAVLCDFKAAVGSDGLRGTVNSCVSCGGGREL